MVIKINGSLLLHSTCGYCSGLLCAFAFTFFIGRRLFALINITVTSSNTCAFGITKPWVFVWALSTSFHVSGVSNVSCLERQSAFVSIAAWLLCGCSYLPTVPSFKCRQLLVFLRVGNPLECLCCCDKPNVRPEKNVFHKILIKTNVGEDSQL